MPDQNSPAPTDRVQEIEDRLADALVRVKDGTPFSANSPGALCEDIEYLLARVRSLEADVEHWKARVRYPAAGHPIIEAPANGQ